jgi:two-component system, chemotaxis family, sensor kinase CheA
MGIIPADAADLVSEEELLELLLNAGFSTKPSVTEISGRGIGLDAVKATLARVQGSLRIGTSSGEGTTVVVTVPQSSQRVAVHRFAAVGADVELCVPASWACTVVPAAGVTPIDPLVRLGVRATREARARAGDARVITLRSAGSAVQVLAGGWAQPGEAERLCPRPEDADVEVVALGGAEALMFRPELLADPGAR